MARRSLQVSNNELGSATAIDAHRYSAVSGLRLPATMAGFEDYVCLPAFPLPARNHPGGGADRLRAVRTGGPAHAEGAESVRPPAALAPVATSLWRQLVMMRCA